jgi:UDP-N-acetylmuramate--alanine ligase
MICSRYRGLRVHLMGIGGAGVGALVPLLRAAGAEVSGCDLHTSPALARLRGAGLEVADHHDPAHLAAIDLVVHSAAIPVDHPELAAARTIGIPVQTRGECLVQLMEGTRTIAIAGSHGKTSTTWMCGHLLVAGGHDPVVMVGGSVASIGGGGRAGGGHLFVAETDESDGSFAQVRPQVAVVTNLDHEHLRHYGSFRDLEDAFAGWLRQVPTDGAVIIPSTGLSPRVLAGVSARIIRVGLDDGDVHAADLRLGPDGSALRVLIDGHDRGAMAVPLPGGHMASNALMAFAAAQAVAADIVPEMLAGCERVRRRFTVHGTPGGVRVVEDYGHHPTEVRATIAAARLGGGRVHVLFQPHRFTRTADCFTGFVAAFDQAHALAILPVYAAGESPDQGMIAGEPADAERLARAIAARRRISTADHGSGQVLHTTAAAAAVAFLTDHAQPGDTVLVLGAGDVGALAPQLVERLGRPAEDPGWLGRILPMRMLA